MDVCKNIMLAPAVSLILLLGVVSNQNVTTEIPRNDDNSTNSTTTDDDDGVEFSFLTKSVISMVGLGVCILIAMIVGKFADRCHDWITIRDDASDMSDKTRDLLKMKNAATFIFRANRKQRNANSKARSFEAATKWGRVWLVKARLSRRDRQRSDVEKISIPIQDTSTTDDELNNNDDGKNTPKVKFSPREEVIPEKQEEKKLKKSSIMLRLFRPRNKQEQKHQQQSKADAPKPNKNIENGFVAVDIEHNNDDKPENSQNKMVEYVDVSEDVRIPVRVSNDETQFCKDPVTRRSITLDVDDRDEISSNSSLAEVAAKLPDVTESPPSIRMGNAWASRENTMTDSSTPDNTEELPGQLLRSKTVESLRLESMSPVVDQLGSSPRPRLGTVGSLSAVEEERQQESVKKPQTAPEKSRRPRPVTAKSSGVLTQGARRKSQVQTPRVGGGVATRPKTPGTTRPKTPGSSATKAPGPRPKTPGPTSSTRPKTPGPTRPKTPGPSRPKTPGVARPKTPGPTSSGRPKTPGTSGRQVTSQSIHS